jgi:hypothetical protein
MNENNYSGSVMALYGRTIEGFGPPGKRNHPAPQAIQQPIHAPWPSAAGSLNDPGIAFSPSADDVAMKVYASHGNHRSFPEEEVRHWLAAESELVAEGNLVQAHGSYNRA